MIIQQLSVFLENKSGRLTEVLEVLGKEQIRITALSVADTTEFGILRIIVTDPEKAKNILKQQKFAVNITGVIAVNVPDEAKYYAKVLKVLSDIDISVEYTYAFTTGKRSVIILRCNNNEEAIKALGDSGIDLLAGQDFYKI